MASSNRVNCSYAHYDSRTPMPSSGRLSVGLNIVDSLATAGDHNEYFFTMPSGVGYEEGRKPSKSTCYYYGRQNGSLGQALFDLITVPRLVSRFKPDVVWSLGNYGLRNPGVPQAILFQQAYLVYDPSEQPRPLWKLGKKTRYSRWRLRRSLPSTNLVFCQTQTTRRRFREVYQYGGPIEILPNAVSRLSLSGASVKKPAVFDRLNDRFVLLCLSRFYPHKNIWGLIDLIRHHHESLKDVVILLTIDPAQDERTVALCQHITKPPFSDHVINVGPIAQADLQSYFQSANAMILPTVLESFSATYLEAMQFGTPILTSDMDFAHEICADAAVYFDPWDSQSIRDAILKLKNDPQLVRELTSRGKSQVERMFRKWDDIIPEALTHLEKIGHGA